MKRFQLLFTFLQLPIDFLMITGAFLLAYQLRLSNFLAPEVIYIMPFNEYLNLTLLIALIWVVIFSFVGMYKLGTEPNFGLVFARTFVAVSVSLAIFIVVLFGAKEQFFSRLIAAYGWGLSIILVVFGRLLISLLKRWFLQSGVIKETVVIIGNNRVAQELKDFYDRKSIKVLVINKSDFENKTQIISKSKTDQVILTIDLPKDKNLELINFCELNNIKFQYLPSLVELYSANAVNNTIRGYPFIELRATPLEGWGRIFKRAFDFIFSVLALIILFPVMVILGVLIRLDSSGPILFVQDRPGQFGKKFKFFKFRTMFTHLCTGKEYGGKKAEEFRERLKQTQNEGAGLLFKVKDDPRVTKFGKFLRKTSLDELPQLLNVLNGEMSLVGPRPPLPDEVDKYDKKIFRRLLVKPGMTGLWQVSGRNDTSFDEYLKLDMYYIEHWSPWLDLQIILKTIVIAIIGKGAY